MKKIYYLNDESLGEEVRVTVIATGYKVDGLPSEEEEVGKKTISEAIEANYPPQQPKPMEDEKVTLIDLSDTLNEEGVQALRAPRERTESTSADDIVITVEDEQKEEKEEKKEETHYSPFGWIRRK